MSKKVYYVEYNVSIWFSWVIRESPHIVISLSYSKDDRSRRGNKTRQGETSLLSLHSSKHPFSEIGRSM